MWDKKGLIFNKHHSQVPVVDVYDNFYRIYYSTRVDGKSTPMFVDVDINNPSNIINESTNPILNLGRPGTFDWAGVMPTDIVTFDNKKYLYYIGWSLRHDVPYHNNLGLAISEDCGQTWKKFSEGPVFHTSHKEPGYIGTVEILIENGVWRMWYLSCLNWIEHDSIMEPTYDIKYAESSDGINWNPMGITCIPLHGDEGGISSCRIIKKENKYIMWYSIRDKINYRNDTKHSYRIKTAESHDGITWKKNTKIDLDISKNFIWDSEMVCYPFIIQKNNKLIMFYNGNGFGKTGIGYAINETVK
jgi:hypothetical protein